MVDYERSAISWRHRRHRSGGGEAGTRLACSLREGLAEKVQGNCKVEIFLPVPFLS